MYRNVYFGQQLAPIFEIGSADDCWEPNEAEEEEREEKFPDPHPGMDEIDWSCHSPNVENLNLRDDDEFRTESRASVLEEVHRYEPEGFLPKNDFAEGRVFLPIKAPLVKVDGNNRPQQPVIECLSQSPSPTSSFSTTPSPSPNCVHEFDDSQFIDLE